jgi:hypothetical protein
MIWTFPSNSIMKNRGLTRRAGRRSAAGLPAHR